MGTYSFSKITIHLKTSSDYDEYKFRVMKFVFKGKFYVDVE